MLCCKGQSRQQMSLSCHIRFHWVTLPVIKMYIWQQKHDVLFAELHLSINLKIKHVEIISRGRSKSCPCTAVHLCTFLFLFYRLIKRERNGKWLTFFSFSKMFSLIDTNDFNEPAKWIRWFLFFVFYVTAFRASCEKRNPLTSTFCLYDSLALLNWKCDHLEHFYIYLCRVCACVCVCVMLSWWSRE